MKDPTKHAAAVFGKLMCTYLEVLDMTAPDELERVIRIIIPASDRAILLDLATQAEVLRAATLAHRLRAIAGPQ